MNIITISREFGSGGRELGKRLADLLGYDYYDSEIIAAIAEKSGLDKGYIEKALDQHGWQNYPITFHSSFMSPSYTDPNRVELLLDQKTVLEEIAAQGKNCIIIGRNADVLLERFKPFRIFVCADLSSRIARCLRYEEKNAPENRMTEKEIRRNILRIDRNRRRTREILTGLSAADGSGFDLTLNAGPWEMEKLSEAVAEFSERWFAK